MPKSQITFPMMYARTKNGGAKWYEVKVVHKSGVSELHRIKASKIGGKAQTDIDEIFEGVNIGKANETTRVQQAEFIAKSTVNKLRDQGYKTLKDLGFKIDEDVEGGYIRVSDETFYTSLEIVLSEALSEPNTDAQGNVKPMLACGYREDKVELPTFLQPKYDGVRCLAIRTPEGVGLFSRGGKPYFASEIEKELLEVMQPGQILDGELYSHKELTFQEIISAVKDRKDGNEFLPKIQYFVYDMPDVDAAFRERWFDLCELLRGKKLKKIVLSQISQVMQIADIMKKHDEWVDDGYEGLMIRNKRGRYEFGNRSNDLIKYKVMKDSEFEIVDVLEATGRDKGTAVFVCMATLKDGSVSKFNARPEGTKELRTSYFNDRKKLIGKMLTVRFQKLSDDGIPIFPVGVIVRDYE